MKFKKLKKRISDTTVELILRDENSDGHIFELYESALDIPKKYNDYKVDFVCTRPGIHVATDSVLQVFIIKK